MDTNCTNESANCTNGRLGSLLCGLEKPRAGVPAQPVRQMHPKRARRFLQNVRASANQPFSRQVQREKGAFMASSVRGAVVNGV